MTNPMTPTEQDKELREKLAAIEHEQWAKPNDDQDKTDA